DLRELRPLLAVALARAPEHGDEPARRQRAQEREHLLERRRGVGVVDDHGERLVALDALHAAGHGLRARERGSRVLEGGARGMERIEGDQPFTVIVDYA